MSNIEWYWEWDSKIIWIAWLKQKLRLSESEIMELLNSFQVEVDFERKVLICKLPSIYSKYIEKLVEWDHFRNTVESKIKSLLNLPFFVTYNKINLYWTKNWLDFYFDDWLKKLVLNRITLCYETENIEYSIELYILYQCLNWYLMILYNYLSKLTDWSLNLSVRKSITSISNRTTLISEIPIKSINWCVFTKHCFNNWPTCLTCLRNPTIQIIQKDPDILKQLKDHLRLTE